MTPLVLQNRLRAECLLFGWGKSAVLEVDLLREEGQ